MEHLPFFISLCFVLTTFLTLFLFVKATKTFRIFVIISIIWLVTQACLGYFGFYHEVKTKPFRFLLAVPPTILFILVLFISKKGKAWVNTLDIKALTLVHIVRIPVEFILYGLFVYKMLPELATFSGRNFDILAGISSPFIYYFGFVKSTISRKIIILWNVVCLILLLNIVINALLAVPTSFQQFAFDQPNIAILYFPFIWLPTFVVPVVLFSHLASLYKLIYRNDS